MRVFFSTLLQSRTLRQLGSIACAALFLAACSSGGGGGGDGTPPAATPTTGTFVDSPVDGLHYTTPSNPGGGFTSGGGHFQCQPGDNVTFDLAGKVIGNPQRCSSDVVTAVSVFGVSSITDNQVVNLARLLLTLGGPPNANGIIHLPSSLPPLPGTLAFSLSTTDFSATIMAASRLALVSEADANLHLQTSFKTLSVTIGNNGTVTSNPAGITCTAGTCSFDFVTDTAVTLTASGASFTGWSDACSGNSPTCVVTLTADTTVTASFDSTAAGVVYPLKVGPTSRYLVDQNGVPFPILGRTAWFITSLSETDYKTFIDDTAAKGYNAIEFHVVNHDSRGNHPPFDGTGALPFTKQLGGSAWAGSLSYGDINNEAPDFSLPNETYWTHVDALLAYAETKGILCFMFPAYTGYGGGSQGWMAEMVANGSTKMQAYGAFIADRYKTRGNIVWMLGGDYGTGGNHFKTPPGPDELGVEQAMLAGMQSVAGQRSTQFSAEWDQDSIYTDQTDPTLQRAGTLQGAYSWSSGVNIQSRNGYAHSPALPTFLLEEPYDEEGPDGNSVNPNPNATQPVRRFQWWGWLSGIGGYISGNGYVWPFNSGWQSHLNTQGAQDMVRLNAFVRSMAWFNLVPSGLNRMKILVTSGGSYVWLSDYVAAAATLDGTRLVAYVPPDHSGSITIDMTAMSGLTRARWFNPASAAYTLIGTFDNTGTASFTPPGDNGTGFTDWLLLLDTQ